MRQAGGTGSSLAGRYQNHDDGRSGSDYGCKAESRGKPPSWRQRRSKGGNRHRNPHTRSGVVRNPDGWSYYKELVVTPRPADRVVQNELKLGRPGAPPNTTTFIMDQHSHPCSLSAPSDDWSYEEQVDDLGSFRPSPVANEPKQGRPGAPPNSTTFIMDQHSHPCNPSALRDDWSREERVDDLCSFRRSRLAQNECWESRPGASPNTTTFTMDQHSHPCNPSALRDDWSREERVDDLCSFRRSRLAQNECWESRPGASPNTTTFTMDQHSHPCNPSALRDDWSREERVDDLCSFRRSRLAQNECWESRPGASPNTTTFTMDQHSHPCNPSALRDDWSREERVNDLCSFRLTRVASEPKLGRPGVPPNTTSFIMDQHSPSVPNDDWSHEEQVDDLCSSRVASEPKLGRPGAPPNSTTFIMDQYRHSYNPLTPSDEFELVWRRC